jgi:hypothetical protein
MEEKYGEAPLSFDDDGNLTYSSSLTGFTPETIVKMILEVAREYPPIVGSIMFSDDMSGGTDYGIAYIHPKGRGQLYIFHSDYLSSPVVTDIFIENEDRAKRYFLFYETRHHGYAIEFVSEIIARQKANDLDNTDMIPCVIHWKPNRPFKLPRISEMDLTSDTLNKIKETKTPIIEIPVYDMYVGNIVHV